MLYYLINMNLDLPNDIFRASNLVLLCMTILLSYGYNLSFTYPIKIFLNDALSNYVLKNYVFYNIIGDKTLPILGRGLRPIGAKNCGVFRDDFFNKNIVSKLSTSYGFPSGHSQNAGFFMTFIYTHFKHNKFILLISLIVTLFIPITRIKFGCHTIEQTIFGYLFGIITYYVFEYIEKKIVQYMKNKNNRYKFLEKIID